MSVTVDLSPKEIAQIKHLTELQSETEAVAKAAREFVRISQLRELKAVSGKLDYRDASEELEEMELREQRPFECAAGFSGGRTGHERQFHPGAGAEGRVADADRISSSEPLRDKRFIVSRIQHPPHGQAD